LDSLKEAGAFSIGPEESPTAEEEKVRKAGSVMWLWCWHGVD
jgi:hypothetical protein